MVPAAAPSTPMAYLRGSRAEASAIAMNVAAGLTTLCVPAAACLCLPVRLRRPWFSIGAPFCLRNAIGPALRRCFGGCCSRLGRLLEAHNEA